MERNFRVNATGCCLVDKIINGVDFSSSAIKPYLSTKKGDGGLSPGELVFRDNLEKYCDLSLEELLDNIDIEHLKKEINIGGPAIVALISMAQILYQKRVEFNFFQNHGNDDNGKYIINTLRQCAPSINVDNYNEISGITAETTVLSDPKYNNQGERTFINTIGSAGDYTTDSLGEEFFSGDLLMYGATALTPGIHNDLTQLLKKGFDANKINVVTTVFDFINEVKNPEDRWPIGDSLESYMYIDLLITDHVEALRLSGMESVEEAVGQFQKWGLKALVITNGAHDVTYYVMDGSRIFNTVNTTSIPVLNINTDEIRSMEMELGDTTGCGDNFAGGVITSIVDQKLNGSSLIDLKEAVVFGNCTGAAACFNLGGVLHEKIPGEKLNIIKSFKRIYEIAV